MHDRPPLKDRPENAVLVLGMHRSGTSLLTGTLEELGLHLGEVRTASPYNRKGNRESIAMQRFHDQLLAKNDASWHQPPNGQCVWDAEDKAAAQRLLSGLTRADQPWGFKDPRSIFTLEGWLGLLARPRLIAMVRPQDQVARSLSQRGPASVPEPQGALLWDAYNRELLTLVERYRIPVLPFPGNRTEKNRFFEGLRSICKAWHLGDVAAANFYDENLIHHGTGDEEGNPLYGKLLAAGGLPLQTTTMRTG